MNLRKILSLWLLSLAGSVVELPAQDAAAYIRLDAAAKALAEAAEKASRVVPPAAVEANRPRPTPVLASSDTSLTPPSVPVLRSNFWVGSSADGRLWVFKFIGTNTVEAYSQVGDRDAGQFHKGTFSEPGGAVDVKIGAGDGVRFSWDRKGLRMTSVGEPPASLPMSLTNGVPLAGQMARRGKTFLGTHQTKAD
jgi:hypothetical protein